MNLLSVLLAATAALSVSVSADDSHAKVHGNVPEIPQLKEAKTGVNATAPAAGNSSALVNGTTGSGAGLTSLKQKTYGSEYHMPYIRVVHARAQGDKPVFMEGRFVSSLGDGDLKSSYRAAMDTVNTASVEGALLFVQAEGINQNSRSGADRCKRRSNMTYIVFYDILIAQTNESIAQYQDTWNVPEYGPYMAMDAGRCTPSSGNDVFQPGCYQYNGDKDQPAVGPVIGAGAKNDDVRAPYPNALWFSFPNTCPLELWGNKRDPNNACRASTRKGLCDIGKAPDGVECSYAYDILGWVTIDDVVGITALTDASGKNYTSYKQWCEASSDHIEFAGDDKTGKMDKGLPFWEEPLDTKRNSERASRVIELYQDVVDGAFKSSGIAGDDLKHFKDLPDPKDLTKTNPPCYKTVKACNSGNGCKRSFFSQVCMPCKDASPDCKVDPSFKFPALEKPKTKLSEDQTTTKLGGKNDASGKLGATSPSAGGSSGNSTSGGKSAAATTGNAATIAALLVAVVAAML